MSDTPTSGSRPIGPAASIPAGGQAFPESPAPQAPASSAVRMELNNLVGVPPLLRGSVTGGEAGSPGSHVVGAKGAAPATRRNVALSDGTHVSFTLVAALPVQDVR